MQCNIVSAGRALPGGRGGGGAPGGGGVAGRGHVRPGQVQRQGGADVRVLHHVSRYAGH